MKADVIALWTKLYALYEGGAHTALGYDSWDGYYVAEFGGSKTTGYQLLDAGRVVAELERAGIDSALAERLPNERVARELAPVVRKSPAKLVDVWNEAQATAKGDAPTAAEVRAIVNKRAPEVRAKKPQVRRAPQLTAWERRTKEAKQYAVKPPAVVATPDDAVLLGLRVLDEADETLAAIEPDDLAAYENETRFLFPWKVRRLCDHLRRLGLDV